MKRIWVQIDRGRDDQGKFWGLSFPDFPGVVTSGRSISDVIRRGRDVFALYSACMAREGITLPPIRTHRTILCDPDIRQAIAKGGATLLCLGVKAAGAHTRP